MGGPWPDLSQRARHATCAAQPGAPLLRRASPGGIPETVNFHLVRHTVATWLAELGINETVIAAILGHSRQGVTALYTHVTQAAMRRGLEAIAKEVLAE